MIDNKNEILAAIIREKLTKEKDKLTAGYLKDKFSAYDPSLGNGDFIALSYIINEALEHDPDLILNLEDFIAHHPEIQQILGQEPPVVSSSAASEKPAGQPEKKKERKKTAETQIILNKMIDQIINYRQTVNSRSL